MWREFPKPFRDAWMDPDQGPAIIGHLLRITPESIAKAPTRRFMAGDRIVDRPYDGYPANSGPVLPHPLQDDVRTPDYIRGQTAPSMDSLVPTATWDRPFDPHTAYLMMLHANLAYHPFTSATWRTFMRGGYHSCFGVSYDDSDWLVLHHPSATVVAFRGTDNANDWFANVSIMNHHTMPEIAVIYDRLGLPRGSKSLFRPDESTTPRWHEGFFKRATAALPALAALLRALAPAPAGPGQAQPQPPHPVFICGHSLGASVSEIAATLLSLWFGIPIAGVYAFGCPKSGNVQAAHLRDFTLGRERVFRVANHRDVVSRVPFVRYVHGTDPIYITSALTLVYPSNHPYIVGSQRGYTPYRVTRADIAAASVTPVEDAGLRAAIQEDRSRDHGATNSTHGSYVSEHCGSSYLRPLAAAALPLRRPPPPIPPMWPAGYYGRPYPWGHAPQMMAPPPSVTAADMHGQGGVRMHMKGHLSALAGKAPWRRPTSSGSPQGYGRTGSPLAPSMPPMSPPGGPLSGVSHAGPFAVPLPYGDPMAAAALLRIGLRLQHAEPGGMTTGPPSPYGQPPPLPTTVGGGSGGYFTVAQRPFDIDFTQRPLTDVDRR
eukprot:TRINITY_DN44992_c0_g1_i1.p1 TRINITY_DN44992_c0_g1~~TRINITY_DN44992_c0_g1_i1.p1  ORF type:complete len:602 (-),score=60.96 TRINITY_DN44992_c0_g1_i1:218-2023(-)